VGCRKLPAPGTGKAIDYRSRLREHRAGAPPIVNSPNAERRRCERCPILSEGVALALHGSPDFICALNMTLFMALPAMSRA
jgi:hypothetical protein